MKEEKMKQVFLPVFQLTKKTGKEWGGFLDLTNGQITKITKGAETNIKIPVGTAEEQKMRKGELVPFHTHCYGDHTNISAADVCMVAITGTAYVITEKGIYKIETKKILSREQVQKLLQKISKIFEGGKIPETHKGFLIEVMLKREFPAEITLIPW